MNLEEAKSIVEPWFTKKEQAILDQFATLSDNSVIIGEGEFRSVFVPGSREDRVLLVAHADTVFIDSPNIKVGQIGGILKSDERIRGIKEKNGVPIVAGMGIGADDRAGIALLWYLKNLGHSILVTNGEENGCLASSLLMADASSAEEINSHRFAVQFDRRGRNDLVFYDVGTSEFQQYCEEETGYKTASGSFTDICVLCETMCGVNISVGYRNEHSCNEILNLRWWARTAETAMRWLSKENLPSFRH